MACDLHPQVWRGILTCHHTPGMVFLFLKLQAWFCPCSYLIKVRSLIRLSFSGTTAATPLSSGSVFPPVPDPCPQALMPVLPQWSAGVILCLPPCPAYLLSQPFWDAAALVLHGAAILILQRKLTLSCVIIPWGKALRHGCDFAVCPDAEFAGFALLLPNACSKSFWKILLLHSP